MIFHLYFLMNERNFDWEKNNIDMMKVLDVIEIFINVYGVLTIEQYYEIIERYKVDKK